MSGQSYKIYSSNRLLQPGEVQNLLCSRCNLLLRDPVQVIACGHRYCKSCLEGYMSHGEGPFMCPVDNESFEKNEVRKDKGCQRELQGLEVSCTTQPIPCEWKGPITHLEAHQAKCPNVEVGVGLLTGTPEQPHPANIATHAKSAKEEVLIICEYCGNRLSNQKQVEEHQGSECTEVEVQCSMNFAGVKCPFKGKPRDMSKHTLTHFAKLLESAFSRIDALEKRVDSLNHHQEGADECVGGECVTRLSSQGQKPEAYDDTQASMVVGGLKDREPPHQLCQKWEEKKQPFQERLKALQQRVDSTQVQAMQDGHLQMVQESWTRPGVALDEVRLRQDILDVKTTNGVLIWKIPNIREKYRDAVDGRTLSLYSPPFYTTKLHGYKMCIRTYLNGDGIGKGTHVSLFFVIMRSEFDALLRWPFEQSVCLSLINQITPTASIMQSFNPDRTSISFQRPKRDMNVASGFPRFTRQSVLHDDHFSHGDTIYIKCQVDPN